MENKQPLVSIVIPVYNGSDYLKQAIDSALNQTYRNIEIIVVNDGSDDDGQTEKTALAYKGKIRYFKKENGGSSSALNYGIREMKGEYFSWLSHDDLYDKKKIEVELQYALKQDDDPFIICKSSLIDKDGNTIWDKKSSVVGRKSAKETFVDLTHSRVYNGCSVLMSRKNIDKIGFFDEKSVYLNDVDYWFRAALCGIDVVYIEDSLVKTRIHEGQVSKKKIYLYNTEKHYLVNKTLDNLESYGIEKKHILEQLAYFSAKENLVSEYRRVRKIAKGTDNIRLSRVRYSYIFVLGSVKLLLRYVRKKLLFRR